MNILFYWNFFDYLFEAILIRGNPVIRGQTLPYTYAATRISALLRRSMNSDSRGSHSRVLMDVQSLLHPFTDLARHERVGPLIIRRGHGATIYDDAGKDYIEGMAGLWCASLGFSDSRVVNAIKRQLDELPTYHLFSGKSHGPAIELAERLKQMAPAPMA